MEFDPGMVEKGVLTWRLMPWRKWSRSMYLRSLLALISPWCTVWCSEIGSLTSLDAPSLGLHASSDVREPISLHHAVMWFCSWWDCVQPQHIGVLVSLPEQIDHLCNDVASQNTFHADQTSTIREHSGACIGRESRYRLTCNTQWVYCRDLHYSPTVAYIRQKPLTTAQCTLNIPQELFPASFHLTS